MKFPGSKLLHHWDLATRGISLDDLLRSCQQAGLTGFAEVKFPNAVAMIFYYLGGEVNALYREGPVAYHGQTALERLRSQVAGDDGSISVYELPLDMAHLLRGITNRQRLKETLHGKSSLQELLNRMEKSEHTGTLEIQASDGAAMVLLVRGRISNTYWETTGGLTYEKGEARKRLEDSVADGEAQIFLSEFSRDIWKNRHEVQASVRSRLERPEGRGQASTDQVAAEESQVRNEILEEISQQVPALIQTFIFDLMTGGVLARKGRGSSAALRVGLIAEKVPSLTMHIRHLVAAEDGDEIELIELSTERVATLVAIVPEAQEAIAVLADKSQPTALIGAALSRAVRLYSMRLHPSRGTAPRLSPS
jgi:hypothetical protein